LYCDLTSLISTGTEEAEEAEEAKELG